MTDTPIAPQIDEEPVTDDTDEIDTDEIDEIDTDEIDADAEGTSSSTEEPDLDDDEPPFTAADYEAAGAELAAEADAAQSEDDQEHGDLRDQEHGVPADANADDGEPEPNLLDGVDPRLAAHIQKLRAEAAANRIAKTAVEERLQAASDVIAELQQWQSDRMRRDVESLCAGEKMIDPSEIWHVAQLGDFLDDETGDIDETKVGGIVEARVPSHWRVQLKHSGRGGMHSGATGTSAGRMATWADVLKPQ
jgi:hypothetical protein